MCQESENVSINSFTAAVAATAALVTFSWNRDKQTASFDVPVAWTISISDA